MFELFLIIIFLLIALFVRFIPEAKARKISRIGACLIALYLLISTSFVIIDSDSPCPESDGLIPTPHRLVESHPWE